MQSREGGVCLGAASSCCPRWLQWGGPGGKFMVHQPPPLLPHVAHLLGKVGEDLGTDPVQPLDDFSLEQTQGDRCRPAQEAWGAKRGQLSQGGGHARGPRAPDRWQGGTGTGPNADWATGG